jgi:hypothetical protein
METLKYILVPALISVLLCGMSGVVRHGSFWGGSVRVEGEAARPLGRGGQQVMVSVFEDPVPRNPVARAFSARVKESLALPSTAERIEGLGAAREELKRRLLQSSR